MERGLQADLDRMLTTLGNKVDPHRTALIVVDVQNDFCHREGTVGSEGRDLTQIQAMVPRLVKFIDEARQVALPIIYIQAIYNSANGWYLSDVLLQQEKTRMKDRYTKYTLCEENSWGAEFYGGIKPLPGEAIVKKHRFSAFIDTELDAILRSKKIRTLIMTGVATNVCVQTTACNGFLKDYYIVLVSDCLAGTSVALHTSALENLGLFFGEVTTSTEIDRLWNQKKG